MQSLGKKDKAITVYEYILTLPKTKFTIRANARLEELMKQSEPLVLEDHHLKTGEKLQERRWVGIIRLLYSF